MTSLSTRREFLRSAGGFTFLALVPIGRGLFAGTDSLQPMALPTFTAVPYIQPGPDGRLIAGAETVRLAWQTVQAAAEFEVHFGGDGQFSRAAAVTRSARNYRGKGDKESRYNYVCEFTGLQLGTEYRYRVRCNRATIAEGYFTTRQPRGRKIRFAAFGDNSFGEQGERAVAYHVYRANPDFIMNTGDNVYEAGLDTEYSRYFFPVYNAETPGAGIGAPLMRSIPFFTVLANHDVQGVHPETKIACADFEHNADALGYYTNFHFPLNGPAAPTDPTVIYGPAARVADFKQCAAARYPAMANYSYDAGDVHFCCLDSNDYIDATDAALQRWVDADLAASDAAWKFVVFHHPPFNVGAHHFKQQQMRVLSPAFERHGVSFVLSGHEHNYQRTRPLRFTPGDASKAHQRHSGDRVIPGQFQLDLAFDGEAHTQPEGVIYVTTGAGGKYLYDPLYNGDPTKWVLPGDNNLAYTVRMISDRHSFTVFDVEPGEVLMRQIDEQGNEIDRVRVTRAGAV